jgi:hypothetical protein
VRKHIDQALSTLDRRLASIERAVREGDQHSMRSTKRSVILTVVASLIAILGTACYDAALEGPDTEPSRTNRAVGALPESASYGAPHGVMIDWVLSYELMEDIATLGVRTSAGPQDPAAQHDALIDWILSTIYSSQSVQDVSLDSTISYARDHEG